MEKFTDDVSNRQDNVTGQKQRFEPYNFDFSSLNFSEINHNITNPKEVCQPLNLNISTPIDRIILEFEALNKKDNSSN